MKYQVLEIVKGILTVASTVVVSIELLMGSGNGQEKKKQAIAKLQEAIRQFDKSVLDIPDWAISILTNEAVLGLLIDALVSFFNKTGFFAKSTS